MAIGGVTAVLAAGDPSSTSSAVLGNSAILAAILFSLACTARAARHRAPVPLGWTLLAIGLILGATGQLGYVLAAASGTDRAPSLVGDVVGFLGYSLPTVAAIFAFARRSELLISRYRQVLDVVVITVGVVLISEATVLAALREVADPTSPVDLIRFAYPISDIAVCALVLCLGMRQPAGDRPTWLLLGSGLLAVAITDSVYVRLLAEGGSDLTATPLVAGWMAGPALIGLASFVPMIGRVSRGRDYTLALQLIPYLPVVGSIVVLSLESVTDDLFLLISGILLLTAVAVRQVMIVYENVSLTRDLEAKVASRTAELTTLGSIVTSSSDAIVGISRTDEITAWNPAAERLYGRAAKEVVGRPPASVMPDEVTVPGALLDRARRGEVLGTYETDWQRPDGSVVPVAMTVSPIVDEDGVQGISVFGQDITERRRAETALEQAREDALESSRLKSEFLATMSHEIRTPMNAVIGLTALLLETELDEIQRSYAEGVHSAGDALLTVINDILDFSKLEAGKVLLDQSDFSPRRLVEEVGGMLAPAASAKRLELIAYCLPEVPSAVHGDGGRIRQILLNLASNAVKFTREGEVVIRVSTVAADADRVELRFEVVDTGIGIAEQDQPRLFESFSQADASTSRRFGGTGLGLAISRRLVEVMGGRIGLQSELGVGSTFSFEVNLRLATTADTGYDEVGQDLLQDLRVLVVDDNATNRALMTAHLEGWQMRAELATGAPAAFSTLRSAALHGRPYDLVALDARMPDGDGLELARRIHADPVLQGIPMIMLTSDLPPEPEVMRAAGIAQWLSKPIRGAELFDRLMRLMAVKESELRSRRQRPGDDDAAPPALAGTVLVVDDHPVSRLVSKRLLVGLGFSVDTVADGQAAIGALEARTYAAVLMEAQLPVTDGFQTTREIRRRERGARRTPVVGVVRGGSVDERERCLIAGMDRFVSRPLDADAVEASLRDLVRPAAAEVVAAAEAEPEGSGAHDDVIDRSRLADLAELTAADGSTLLHSLIESFVRRSPSRLAAIDQAAAEGDVQALAAVAHELKGSAGTIGAHRVMACAAEIEALSRAGTVGSPELLARLRGELDAATRALSDIDVLQ